MKLHRSRKALATVVSLLMLCSAILFISPQSVSAASEFTVNSGTTLVPDYVGNGSEYNQNLYSSISSVDGITTSNVGLLENEVKTLQ